MNNNKSQLIICDNFYDDPNQIRYLALRQGLCNHGYHPGMRTLPCFNHEAHDKITALMNKPIYPSGDCYAFQFNTATDVSWIHTDVVPNELITNPDFDFWAAVIYLSPEPILSCGTTLYKHKKYGYSGLKDIINNEIRRKGETTINALSKDGSDLSKWTKATTIGNVYNRIVLYDASYYHASSNYFGNTKEDCRLLQIFFFHTKKHESNIKKPAIEYRTNDFMNHTNTLSVNTTSGFLNKLKN
jgi:hypothetical protein